MPDVSAAQREAIARAAMATIRTWTPDVQIRCARCWAVVATIHITKMDTIGRFMYPLDPHMCTAADLERVAGWEKDAETSDPDPVSPDVIERLRADPVLADRLDPDRVSERAFGVADAVLGLVAVWVDEARRDERERLLADVQYRVTKAQLGHEEWPESDYWRGRLEALAELRNKLRNVLAAVSRDTRSSSE